MEATVQAMTNRSLRNIRTELEFLTDSSVITPQQLSSILAELPGQTQLHAPLLNPSTSSGRTQTPALPTRQSANLMPPVSPLANTTLNEKSNSYYSPGPPPPAYASTPSKPPALATASALYAYTPADSGDLALQPNDRIAVEEYMNPEWWKGRNERTGQEGIFPSSYVKVVEEKSVMVPTASASGYGNMPLQVSSNDSAPAEPGKPSKVNENGKKFGKKMGNAAVFGAGATIGSKIVNGIF
ncbi:MAG: hypothetical protein M1812_006956 [Candelaria pacifica]|nr:MAG: hypothetical protein M1812_006956 [Candelaria pacifica]